MYDYGFGGILNLWFIFLIGYVFIFVVIYGLFVLFFYLIWFGLVRFVVFFFCFYEVWFGI